MFQEWVEEFEKNKVKNMSEADKMFEELGYKIVNCNPMCEEYRKCNKIENAIFYEKENHYMKECPNIYDFDYIIFDLDKKRFLKFNYNHQRMMFVTVQELQAINKKGEELKWMN